MEEDVYKLLKRIPRGKVTTYKEIARVLGIHPRKVGRILNKNPLPIKLPCHRVVHSDGRIGGYSLGIEIKKKLLEEEGIEIKNGKIDLKKYGFYFTQRKFRE
jgi:methylated-DNA-[protein]-cysteine S-methyltransferase